MNGEAQKEVDREVTAQVSRFGLNVDFLSKSLQRLEEKIKPLIDEQVVTNITTRDDANQNLLAGSDPVAENVPASPLAAELHGYNDKLEARKARLSALITAIEL